MADQEGSEGVHVSHGRDLQSLSENQKALKYQEKRLKFAIKTGDRAGEERAYEYLGNAYQSLCDYRKAIECHEKWLKIAIDIGDPPGEGRAYENLGIAYQSLCDYRKAIEYHEKRLKIAIKIGDRAAEGRGYGNLDIAYQSLGDHRKAVEYHEKHLKIAKEIGNRAAEGIAYGNLGNVYQLLGDYRKAIEYNQTHLKIALEIGDRAGEGRCYGSLGNAWTTLGNYRKAIKHHEKHLKLAKEIGDRAGEGAAHGDLGNAYQSLADYQKAIENHQRHLKIATEIGDRAGEGIAYGNLGRAYNSLSDYRKAIEYHEKHLKIALEIGGRDGEGVAYGSLGNAYQLIGDFKKATKYLKRLLKLAREIGNREGEGKAHGSLGSALYLEGDYQGSIEHLEQFLKIAIEIGDRAGEGTAYGNLGNAYQSLGDYLKATEYHETQLKIAIEIGDRALEGRAHGCLGNAFASLGHYGKSINYLEKQLKIAKEIGDRAGEGMAYSIIGNVYFSLEQFEVAVDNFVDAVDTLNSLRSLLKSEDTWKINFRERHQASYTALWRSLLRIGKVDEALLAAEQGRAQSLSDNLLIQYKLPASLSAAIIDNKATTFLLCTESSTPIVFLAIEGLMINIWFLSRRNKIVFRQGRLEDDSTEKDPIPVLLQSSLEKMRTEDTVRCEDRTFREHDLEYPFSIEVQNKGLRKQSLPPSNNPFKPFFEAIIDPIIDLLGFQDDELVIVPDGALCLTPWPAVIESIRIRTVPSLTSYQLILSVPEGHHMKKGALLVGNPCLSQLRKPLDDLPCAQKEVEMIASILNTVPLIGRQATKVEVMKRMSTVGLIHIAAHGNKVTGEIALSPNPGWTSQFPQEEDFILKMSDVQAANLRARLVVLSCCHSGRGRILRGEGVVGIARAFLAAGARSVLVALWAIDDEATMVFMKTFYQHLKEGKTASVAVSRSIKSLRESEKFSEMRYWAPFQLIGDDVKIEFEADDVKKRKK
ncbi:PREDICTED: tetratricopeptide repeat protein 28-like [Acropora digitifera]|uniref:tetratricopeptide repeat protein 28-like n=1 Tax=Acropora digitifera TaxID=70779 RepID=UPI00077A16AA|nr:PREDICTED: tetratricopeptide repeat protein 28-like [Acropora digitifera]